MKLHMSMKHLFGMGPGVCTGKSRRQEFRVNSMEISSRNETTAG
jgi:hypothetical protein